MLEIQQMDIESHASGACIYDYLQISFLEFSWKFCGQSNPGQFRGNPGAPFRITFHTDNLGTAPGFFAKWKEVEGRLCKCKKLNFEKVIIFHKNFNVKLCNFNFSSSYIYNHDHCQSCVWFHNCISNNNNTIICNLQLWSCSDTDQDCGWSGDRGQ